MVEVEYKFLKIDKNQILEKLKEIGAKLVHAEFKMIRCVFHQSTNPQMKGRSTRVRKEFGKITLTHKDLVNSDGFPDEIEVEVSDFDGTVSILKNSGLNLTSTQESLRETWQKGDVFVMIDTRPHMETYVEIESKIGSEDDVKNLAFELGLDWESRTLKGITDLYSEKYSKTIDEVRALTENLTFNKNPFE